MGNQVATELAVALIQGFEGLRLAAYPDPGSGGAPYTVGWGSTGPDITKDTVWTVKQAENRLRSDVQKFMDGIKSSVHVDLNDNQLAALTSFSYNLGLGNLKQSTLLRKLNASDFAGAAAEFPKWTKAAGRELAGLVTRRAKERALFEGRA